MAEIREGEFRKLLSSAFAGIDGVLFYGNDEESMADVTRQTLSAWRGGGEVVVIEASSLRGGSGELKDHLFSQSLFGGRGLVLVRGCEEQHAPALLALIGEGGWSNALLLQAGSLRKNSALRAAIAKSKRFHAVAFYAEDESAFLDRVRSMATEKGLRFDEGAAERLAILCGTDRSLVAIELEKLALLSTGAELVTVQMVEESCGDQAASDMEALMDAVLSGEPMEADRLLQRAVGAPEFSGLLPMFLSRLSRLADVRAALDAGASWESAFAKARPPVFFPQQPAMKRQLSGLSLDGVMRLQEQLQEWTLQARRLGAVGDVFIARNLISLATRLSAVPPRRH